MRGHARLKGANSEKLKDYKPELCQLPVVLHPSRVSTAGGPPRHRSQPHGAKNDITCHFSLGECAHRGEDNAMRESRVIKVGGHPNSRNMFIFNLQDRNSTSTDLADAHFKNNAIISDSLYHAVFTGRL